MTTFSYVLFAVFLLWIALTACYGILLAMIAWYYALINRDGFFQRTFWTYLDMVIDDIVLPKQRNFWQKIFYVGYWICAGPITLVSRIW